VTSIAVLGAGPAGCFMADALARKLPAAAIDVIDRLPTPYGLVRGGVAPDHQGTKAIVRQFERVFQRPEVRFRGNVTVGRDVSLAELRRLYDAVVVAVGAGADRRLGITGEELPGVYGSGAFVGWYNGHPEHRDLAPRLDSPGVAVVGNGNVALDVARLLAKTPAELAASDLPAHAAAALAAAPVTDIWIIGRRGPMQAGFSPAELAELGRLERAAPQVDPADVAEGEGKVVDLLRGYAARAAERPVRIRFLFHAAPIAVLGRDRAEALRLARTRVVDDRAVTTEQTMDIAAGTVITAIGYATPPLDELPMSGGRVANADGRVAPRLYATGWARRGASGTIPANRADAMAVADLVAADLAGAEGGRPGGGDLDALLAARGVRAVGFADWRRVDAAEIAAAGPGRPREKLTRTAEMLRVAFG